MSDHDYNPNDDQDHEPLGVEDVINERRRFHPKVMAAVRAFRRARPFRGSIDEQKAALQALHAAMGDAYSLSVALEFADDFGEDIDSTRSQFWPAFPVIDHPLAQFIQRNPGTGDGARIVLGGRMSLVSYLHLVGVARGLSPADCCEFSLNLFKRVFPKSFERAEKDGMVLRRPRRD